MRKLWAPEYADEVIDIFQPHSIDRGALQHAKTGRVPWSIASVRSTTSGAWIEFQCQRVAFGLVCYFRDISIEVLAEEALRKSEKLAAVGRIAATNFA